MVWKISRLTILERDLMLSVVQAVNEQTLNLEHQLDQSLVATSSDYFFVDLGIVRPCND